MRKGPSPSCSTDTLKRYLTYFGFGNDTTYRFDENNDRVGLGREFLESVSTDRYETLSEEVVDENSVTDDTGEEYREPVIEEFEKLVYIDENYKRAVSLEEKGEISGHALMIEPFKRIMESEEPLKQFFDETGMYLENLEDY